MSASVNVNCCIERLKGVILLVGRATNQRDMTENAALISSYVSGATYELWTCLWAKPPGSYSTSCETFAADRITIMDITLHEMLEIGELLRAEKLKCGNGLLIELEKAGSHSMPISRPRALNGNSKYRKESSKSI